MRILAWPAFKTRYKNPYNWLLYRPMEAAGVIVEELTPLRLLVQGYDVVHIHWPVETIVRHPRYGIALLRVLLFLGLLRWSRLRGAKLLWTIHDDAPHVLLHPRLAAWCQGQLGRITDATLHLCQASVIRLRTSQPELAQKPTAVVPHGHYRGIYPGRDTQASAREGLGLPGDAPVCLYLGYISPYKNIPHLVTTFRQLPLAGAKLLVAGKPDSTALGAAITAAAGADPRVELHLRFIPDAELQRWFAAADLVVLPFTDILNSGSALMALSFDRPVLVPHLGAIPELQQQVGASWVHTYDGPLAVDRLAAAIAAARSRPPGAAPLAPLDWEHLSQQTIQVYRQLTR